MTNNSPVRGPVTCVSLLVLSVSRKNEDSNVRSLSSVFYSFVYLFTIEYNTIHDTSFHSTRFRCATTPFPRPPSPKIIPLLTRSGHTLLPPSVCSHVYGNEKLILNTGNSRLCMSLKKTGGKGRRIPERVLSPKF